PIKSRRFTMSALPPKADIGTKLHDVRFVPKADIGSSFDRPCRRWQVTPLQLFDTGPGGYAQYSKSSNGFRYVALNPSSTALSSALGLPNTVKRVRSTISSKRPANILANACKCPSAAAEVMYRS